MRSLDSITDSMDISLSRLSEIEEDREAKQASLQSPAQQFIVIPNIKPLCLPEEKTRLLQEEAQPQRNWLQKQGRYVLHQSQATQILTDIHQVLHLGTKPLYHLLMVVV